MTVSQRQRPVRWLCPAAIAIVAVLGLLRLPEPFHGDQALFALSSSGWSEGGKLYEDLWDLKQPAIHTFYLVGGLLFGFTEVGVHSFELLYMMLFCGVLIFAMREHFENDWALCLVPLLTVGCYFAVSEDWHLTQIEGLVGVPIFIGIWLASPVSREDELKSRDLYLSGLMGGVVFCFKMLYTPVVGFSWLVAIATARFLQRHNWKWVLTRIIAPIAVGWAIPVVLFAAYFAFEGTLDLVYWISFVYPPQVVGVIEPQPWRLLHSVNWLTARLGSLYPLAFIGAYGRLRRGLDVLTLNLVGWIAVGSAAILVQTVSWWEYHMLLLIFPIGILASLGVDLISSRLQELGFHLSGWSGRAAALGLGVLLFASPVLNVVPRTVQMARHDFAIGRSSLREFQNDASPTYAEASREVAFLEDPRSLPGNIYVFGNPIFQYKSGRAQAIAMNGWSFDILLLSQWEEVLADLQVASPPYIFVERGQWPFIDMRFPDVRDFLSSTYEVLRDNSVGTWFVIANGSSTWFPPE